MRKTTNWCWFLLSALIVMADQLTKYMAQMQLNAYQPYPVLPMFNLTLAYNTGAAFSFLNSASGWQNWLFGSLAVMVSLMVLIWLSKLPAQACWMNLAL